VKFASSSKFDRERTYFLQTYITAKSIKPLLLTKHINALNDYDFIDKNVKLKVKETKILRKNKRLKK